ncbi:MAG: DCC1-like thiol-disulfide oxidoreductase family protein [Pseudomonadota bacterium]
MIDLRAKAAHSYRDDPAVPAFDGTAPIVIVDGECVLCTRSARLLSRLDKSGTFRICPSQSRLGSAILVHYGLDPADPDTWLYLVDGRAYSSMDAIIRVGWRVGGVGRAAVVLRVLPRFVQDWLYRRVARNRYWLFGRTDMCAVPDEGLRRRLIE